MSQPSREILYSYPKSYTDVLEWQRDNKVKRPIMFEGAVVPCTASGSTFTLYNPARVAVVSAAAVTVPGTGDDANVATYTVLAASLPSTVTLGEGWMMVWSLVTPDGTRRIAEPCSVARQLLYPVVDDQALTDEQANVLTHGGVTTHQPKIRAAWAEIIAAITAGGWLSYTMMPAVAFREWHLFLTLEKVYRSYTSGQPNKGNWKELADYYGDRAQKARAQLSVQLTDEKQAFITDFRARSAVGGVLRFNGAPSTFLPAGY